MPLLSHEREKQIKRKYDEAAFPKSKRRPLDASDGSIFSRTLTNGKPYLLCSGTIAQIAVHIPDSGLIPVGVDHQ
jgi:hypothetical protein